MTIDGAVTDTIDPARERSRPVKLHPPKFSEEIHPEIARYHREIAEAIETESNKTWQMRREMERVDTLGQTIARMSASVDFWTQATKDMLAAHNGTATALATITVQVCTIVSQNTMMMAKLDRAYDEIRKLENKAFDTENDISLIKMSSAEVKKQVANFAETVEQHGNRIGALETIRLVENSEQAGQQKLLTKGRVVGGAMYTVGIFVVAKWSWFTSLFHK